VWHNLSEHLRQFYQISGLRVEDFKKDEYDLNCAYHKIEELWTKNLDEHIKSVRYILLSEAPLWGNDKKYIYNPDYEKDSIFFKCTDLSFALGKEISTKIELVRELNQIGFLIIDISPFALNSSTRINYTSLSRKKKNNYPAFLNPLIDSFLRAKLEKVKNKIQGDVKIFYRYPRTEKHLGDSIETLLKEYGLSVLQKPNNNVFKQGGGVDKVRLRNILDYLYFKMMLESFIGNIPQESGFIKKFRLHQGWWRTFVLNEPEGVYTDSKGNCTSVCNRINNGKKSLKNFLSKEIADSVADALKEQKISGSGIMDEDRLYNNLLSSQPLAFNLFAFFNNNKGLALEFLKTIRPDITYFDKVVFEYAPDSNKDSSAFDIGFVVKSGNKNGYIGLECKYTDTFSYRRKGGKVNYGDKSEIEEDQNYGNYFKLYSENRDRFPDDYFSYVRSKDYNQLFRNELLAVQLKSNFEFVVTGLFCHHEDKETINSGKEFQKKIGNGVNDFITLTYADYFERIQKLNLSWVQREQIMMLWVRYCGLRLSRELLNTT